MELMTNLMNWLNAEEDDTIVLQRDGIYALLSWKDFNQPQPPVLTFRTAAYLFVIALALPMLAMM